MAAKNKLYKSDNKSLLFIDLLMVFIVIFNLSWLFFDMAYAFTSFRNLLEIISPRFNLFYGSVIHPQFILFDIIFVLIYLIELSIRWGISIYKKTYSKWFFYPFVHWYDVLGCLPISGFRVLRLLRLFSMVYRLERLGIINLSETYLYKEAIRYRKIFIEEISDRVVINVLSGVNEEIKKDSPVVNKIIKEVLIPRQELMIDWTSQNMSSAADKIFNNNRDAIKSYLEDLVARAVKDNKDIGRLKLIPGIGKLIADIIENSISDITFNIITESVNDIILQKNNELIKNVSHDVFELMLEHNNETTEEFLKSILTDTLEIIKDEVAVKQWQVEEEKKKQEKIKARVEQKIDKMNKQREYL